MIKYFILYFYKLLSILFIDYSILEYFKIIIKSSILTKNYGFRIETCSSQKYPS